MGAAIARRLIDTGVPVQVYDVRRERTAGLAEQGAQVAVSAREATSSADFVNFSLNTAPIVESAVFGEEGIAAAADSSKLLIDMSSIDPAATKDPGRAAHPGNGHGMGRCAAVGRCASRRGAEP